MDAEKGVRLESAGLTLRVLPASQRPAVAEVWRAVEAAADATPFCGWEWTSTWLRHYGEVVPHVFAVAERENVPVGAALLTRSIAVRGPVRLRRIHVGTAGEPLGETVYVEHNGLCTSRRMRGAFAAALVDYVHRSQNWDELCLDGFAPEHAAAFVTAEPRLVVDERTSQYIDLAATQADLVDALSSKSTRSAIRRSIRGLAPVSTEWAATVEDAHRILDDLEKLHQERWTARDEPGVFASTRFSGFHREMIAAWVPQGRAALFAVRSGEETVAALYCFVMDGAVQFYQSGFQLAKHNKIRVGYAAHLLMAGEARERGHRLYEYLTGEHRYKDELSTGARPIVWATLSRRRPRAMMLTMARRAQRALQDRRAQVGQ